MAGRRASSSLDGHLRRWLSAIAKGWRMPVNAAARALGVREIANRTKWYPEIGSLLLRGNYTARKCSEEPIMRAFLGLVLAVMSLLPVAPPAHAQQQPFSEGLYQQ